MERLRSITVALIAFAASCQSPTERASPQAEAGAKPRAWALCIHGGAGVTQLNETQEQAYRSAMRKALELGKQLLSDGASALDTVEKVVNSLEDDALFNSGKGAVYTAETTHELDASIMDGRDRSCGAITGVKTIKNPISLARIVMENSPHVFFSGDGAEKFADGFDINRVDNSYFDTPRRLRSLQKKMGKKTKGTVGCVALDHAGNLAAATSTGGMTAKKFGRIGDSPVIGAGTYADNQTCAVSCTGWGEKFIKNTIARDVAAQMQYGNRSLQSSVDHLLTDVLDPKDGGIIAVDRLGNTVTAQNTIGMFRARADSLGLDEVKIWASESASSTPQH